MPEVSSHALKTTDGSSELGKAASGRRRGRRRGVEIRPGSVKQARLEAGLSLGQVAREDISRTAIYFVETGKAKPSMETLLLIADRTGRPLDFFLGQGAAMTPTARIAEMERLLASGDNDGAAAAGDELLGSHLDRESKARVELVTAMAYLRLAQPVTGRRLALAARSYFEQSGDVIMTAESLGTEAQAAYLMQDASSLPLAEAALAAVRSLKPVPQATEARLLMVLAGVHLLRRDWHAAIDLYKEAIALGDVVRDLHQLSLMYSGLSGAYNEVGQFSEATRYAQKALTIHETLRDRLSLARSLNNLGYMLVHLREFVSARVHLDRSLGIYVEEGVETGRSYTILSLCELEFEQGDFDQAEVQAREAVALTSKLGESALEAEGRIWLGRIAAMRGLHEVADAEFDSAFTAVQPLGRGARLTEVHEAYAEVLEARGDLAGANRHLKEAIAAFRPGAPGALESRIAIA